jgi:RND family efflux transporter MFP subunit
MICLLIGYGVMYFLPVKTQTINTTEKKQIDNFVDTQLIKLIEHKKDSVFIGHVRMEKCKIVAPWDGLITYIVPKQPVTTIKKGEILFSLCTQKLKLKLEELEAEYDLAHATYNRIKNLGSATSQQNIDEALSKLKVISARITSIKDEISHSNIVTPVDAVVEFGNICENTNVNRGEEIMFIHNQQKIIVETHIPISDSDSLLNAENTIYVQLHDSEYPAKIIYISPKVEPTSNISNVHLQINANKITIGELCKVIISNKNLQKYAIIPETAVIFRGPYTNVFLVKNGFATSVPIKYCGKTPNGDILTQGLVDGDAIVVSGGGKLHNHTPITIVNKVIPPDNNDNNEILTNNIESQEDEPLIKSEEDEPIIKSEEDDILINIK